MGTVIVELCSAESVRLRPHNWHGLTPQAATRDLIQKWQTMHFRHFISILESNVLHENGKIGLSVEFHKNTGVV
jgi:hypothetical protein